MNPKIIAVGIGIGTHAAKNNPINDAAGCVDNQVDGILGGIFGGGNKVQTIHTGKKKETEKSIFDW